MAEDQQRGWATGMKWLAGIGALLVVAALVNRPDAPAQSAADAATQPEAIVAADPAPQNDPGISAAEFTQLRVGMSPDQAAAIVGSAGEVISESEIAGISGLMLQWQGESGPGANASAMFQNGELVQKSQFGLE